MTTDHIYEKVRSVLIEEFELEAEAIHPEAHLITDLGLDSLDAVDLVVGLERAFGGRVPETEARKVRTVSDVCGLIERTYFSAAPAMASDAVGETQSAQG